MNTHPENPAIAGDGEATTEAQKNQEVTHVVIGGDSKATSEARKYADALQALGYKVTFIEYRGEGDYPAYVAERVCLEVQANPGSRGIIFCVTGLGTSDAGSTVPGTTCVGPICYKDHAERAATSNNANVITIPTVANRQSIPLKHNLSLILAFLKNVPNWDPNSHSAKNMAANQELDRKYRRMPAA